MAYDALAESVALIETGRVERVPRLTRRRRFAAMAVDVAGDVAATMFARRGVGCIWQEVHVLVLRGGVWTLLGGGGSDGDQDLLADRPAVLPAYLRRGSEAAAETNRRVMVVSGSGGVLDNGDEVDRPPSRGRWVSYAAVRVNAQVASVRVAEKLLDVPWHGHVLVVWSGRPPGVVAFDDDGKSLIEIQLPSGR